jgi:GNAT superfamily N-acetyltransferase
MELLGHIWEGQDYVPGFWDAWLQDQEGRLVVAEGEKRIAGLGRLARKSPDEWWLQGLRVHPDFLGQGVASQIHDFLVGVWREEYGGTLRLSTVSTRLEVHHLCERTGFTRIGDYSFYRAPTLPPEEHQPPAFEPLSAHEIESALNFIRQSLLFEPQAGMWALGWEWVRPSASLLEDAIQRGMAWWWRGHRGFLAYFMDEDDTESVMPFLHHITCPLEELADCLVDYRRLAGHHGYAQAGWEPNLVPALVQAAEAAGFQRSWDKSTYLYAQEGPHRIEPRKNL